MIELLQSLAELLANASAGRFSLVCGLGIFFVAVLFVVTEPGNHVAWMGVVAGLITIILSLIGLRRRR